MTSETRVIYSDLELWACAYIRQQLAILAPRYPVAAGVEVTNREPEEADPHFPAKLVVVRDDSGPTLSVVSEEKSHGVSTLAGTVESQADAKNLAALVFAIMDGCAGVEAGNPVAAVTESQGPYLVTEDQPRARMYATHSLVVVGQAL